MKPIKPEDRRIANIFNDQFKHYLENGVVSEKETVLQINAHERLGIGFHVYRMAPGTQTTPHQHKGDEEFLVLEGELVDNDGQVYRKGDLVWLKDGTQHTSYSKDGALLAVYIAGPEKAV